MWSNACILFKHTAKMLRVFESQFIRYFTHRFCVFQNITFRYICYLQLNKFKCRFSRFFLYQIAKIIGRQMHLLRKIPNGCNSIYLRILRLEIVFQQSFKFLYGSTIHMFPGHELSVVKPNTIVE